jgi:uncharacterized protein DUF4326
MPPNAVYVGRPSRWGNPYVVGQESLSDPQWRYNLVDVLGLYRLALLRRLETEADFLEPLRGKVLADWCNPCEPCHGDVILEVLGRG